MTQVVRLKSYRKAMQAMGLGKADMKKVERMILLAPNAHPAIKGLRGARKARFALSEGKSFGGRAIYYAALIPDFLFMLTAYPKSERDDLSQEQRKSILDALESIKETL